MITLGCLTEANIRVHKVARSHSTNPTSWLQNLKMRKPVSSLEIKKLKKTKSKCFLRTDQKHINYLHNQIFTSSNQIMKHTKV